MRDVPTASVPNRAGNNIVVCQNTIAGVCPFIHDYDSAAVALPNKEDFIPLSEKQGVAYAHH